MTIGDIGDDGQPIERAGQPSDRFRSPFPNERAARAANNGAYPPDLSVMVKARASGERMFRRPFSMSASVSPTI